MEELRSTEILDREIQSDARKKAENILKKADKSCEEILNSVEKTIEEARKTKEDFYNKTYPIPTESWEKIVKLIIEQM